MEAGQDHPGRETADLQRIWLEMEGTIAQAQGQMTNRLHLAGHRRCPIEDLEPQLQITECVAHD
ncbi:protein of unknown function [Nitrospira defluvii]|uniref:Uncharacterized protein n=1 Tax=Nitrospira defluvii TaxID=330214 RepID=D8PEN2_9BACT|nr:protein of unknown function [Nitrospira defluvii]